MPGRCHERASREGEGPACRPKALETMIFFVLKFPGFFFFWWLFLKHPLLFFDTQPCAVASDVSLMCGFRVHLVCQRVFFCLLHPQLGAQRGLPPTGGSLPDACWPVRGGLSVLIDLLSRQALASVSQGWSCPFHSHVLSPALFLTPSLPGTLVL